MVRPFDFGEGSERSGLVSHNLLVRPLVQLHSDVADRLIGMDSLMKKSALGTGLTLQVGGLFLIIPNLHALVERIGTHFGCS